MPFLWVQLFMLPWHALRCTHIRLLARITIRVTVPRRGILRLVVWQPSCLKSVTLIASWTDICFRFLSWNRNWKHGLAVALDFVSHFTALFHRNALFHTHLFTKKALIRQFIVLPAQSEWHRFALCVSDSLCFAAVLCTQFNICFAGKSLFEKKLTTAHASRVKLPFVNSCKYSLVMLPLFFLTNITAVSVDVSWFPSQLWSTVWHPLNAGRRESGNPISCHLLVPGTSPWKPLVFPKGLRRSATSTWSYYLPIKWL